MDEEEEEEDTPRGKSLTPDRTATRDWEKASSPSRARGVATPRIGMPVVAKPPAEMLGVAKPLPVEAGVGPLLGKLREAPGPLHVH